MIASACDVLVIGGGLAGLCAALAAREQGVGVRLAENASAAMRGGNARHARNFRAAHRAPGRYSPDGYAPEEFLAELTRIGGQAVDTALAHSLIEESEHLPDWLIGWGVRLQDPQAGMLPYSRRTAFLLGGGKAMLNALYRTAQARGVGVDYDVEVVDLRREAEGLWRAEAVCGDERRALDARCVVVATGGAGADFDWLREQLGPMADQLAIRGAAGSNGRLMQRMIDAGAQTVGEPSVNHMVAVDARGPKYDGGIVTRITAIPYGLVVDGDGRAVTLDGVVKGPSHYAIWGPKIAACKGGIAYLILDAVGLLRSEPTAFAPIEAPTLALLGERLGLDPEALAFAAERFNADRHESGPALATPPFSALPLRGGLTFVHYGVAIDGAMRVRMRDGGAREGLFAAGAIVAANVLPRGYLAGFGLTLAALTGRRAGRAAASHVLV